MYVINFFIRNYDYSCDFVFVLIALYYGYTLIEFLVTRAT